MVKVAIAGAAGELGREILDGIVERQKHEIIALVRRDPSLLPQLQGVTWTQTSYESESELVQLLKGVDILLCVFAVHRDPGNATQKMLIDAAIKAGVRRYAPAEWATSMKLDAHLDLAPWNAGKVEIRCYLQQLNREKKVLEYSCFQVGILMDYLGHPHRVSKYLTTMPVTVDIEKCHALVLSGSLTDKITFTAARDIGKVVARAIEYEGEWPLIGGVSGNQISFEDLIRIGERVRGTRFTIENLEQKDLEAGELKTDNFFRVPFPDIPEGQVESFSKLATISVMLGAKHGLWTVTDEWNEILPEQKFTQVEDFLREIWGSRG
ncbi:unnamed protein product [Clonostachys chloroleuca]|uniref:NmrA-like domain-containing protein n=1 Tax=Clonostachys chloroleuca TaxID=1926264 RepID=A0AA35QBE6_9HYPO|nr:unnamed protein product [Clonostachys chloroleuca]